LFLILISFFLSGYVESLKNFQVLEMTSWVCYESLEVFSLHYLFDEMFR